MKNLILVDMDGVLADFCRDEVFTGRIVNDQSCAAMYEPGFFLRLLPVDGALVGVRELMRMGFDVQIATQPVAESAHSYLEKVQWIGLWFPELIKKVHMIQDKGLLCADYLIDDRPDKWKAGFEANGGRFVHFDYAEPQRVIDSRDRNAGQWEAIVEYFKLVKEFQNE